MPHAINKPKSETSTGRSNDPQARRTDSTRPIGRDRVRKPIARRVPGDVRNTCVSAPASRDGIDAFARLGVEDFDAIAAAAGLVAGAADVSTVEAPAKPTDSTAVLAEQCALADHVGGIPERDEGIASTSSDVAPIRGKADAEAG